MKKSSINEMHVFKLKRNHLIIVNVLGLGPEAIYVN